MTADKLHDAISLLPHDLIAETDKLRSAPRPVIRWQRYAAMAACFAVILFAGTWCMQLLSSTKTTESCAAEAPAAMQADAAPAAPAEAAPKTEAAPEDAAPAEPDRNSAMGTVPSVIVHPEGIAISLPPEDAASVAVILAELDYRPENSCECIAEITLLLNGEIRYHVNLEEGFVRCHAGQAYPDPQQLQILREILMPYT